MLEKTCFETLYQDHRGNSCANGDCAYNSSGANQSCSLTNILSNIENDETTWNSFKDPDDEKDGKHYYTTAGVKVRDMIKILRCGQGSVLVWEERALKKIRDHLINTDPDLYMDATLPGDER